MSSGIFVVRTTFFFFFLVLSGVDFPGVSFRFLVSDLGGDLILAGTFFFGEVDAFFASDFAGLRELRRGGELFGGVFGAAFSVDEDDGPALALSGTGASDGMIPAAMAMARASRICDRMWPPSGRLYFCFFSEFADVGLLGFLSDGVRRGRDARRGR